MTSIIKVDNLQNQCGANIINENAGTITIGASGDTITLAAGASQSGFGRSGSVNWDTTPKTTGFTAVSGNGYFCDTTSAAFTVTLPATPAAGDIVAIADYDGTALTNAITIGRNSSNINGAAADLTISANYSAVTLVYVDATSGWRSVDSSNPNDIVTPPEYVAATGGTVTCCGDYKIHTFTGPGTFTVTSAGNPLGSNTVDYLIVAGGGGGGGTYGGGGGAGGFREGYTPGSYTASPLATTAMPVSVTAYPITIGGGGTSESGQTRGGSGIPTTALGFTSTGGGGAGAQAVSSGLSGGSGGGASYSDVGGAGNTPPVSPPQGNTGGSGGGAPGYTGGGGGGATVAGTAGVTNCAGAGGAGATSSIDGTPTARAGGGGGSGGGAPLSQPFTAGTGGAGGGGAGAPDQPSGNGTNGTTNTGGGGGGNNNLAGSSGAGGSGIVVIRYKFQ
jgi:hypothetical protein